MLSRAVGRSHKAWLLASVLLSSLELNCERRSGTVLTTSINTAVPASRGGAVPAAASAATVSAAGAASNSNVASTPAAQRIDRQDSAMGTSLHFIVYTHAQANAEHTNQAIDRAIAEMRRLEQILSEWRPDSEVSTLNAHAGEWVKVGPETFQVLNAGIKAGQFSRGTFDITFQAFSDIWKFGSAQAVSPELPSKQAVEARRKLVDYRRILLDAAQSRAQIGKGQKLGLGGIAKGYIVDKAAQVLRAAGLVDFLVQAGGDLFGAGRKPDGSPWVSGIQDPRAPEGEFFASIELTDHAFSTAGDYARAYVLNGKRYHHIIDPRSGYPASACRSVTIWAEDALTADAVDDAVFILGAEPGLALVESMPGVGAVIVDHANKVWVSERIKRQVTLVRQPSDGI